MIKNLFLGLTAWLLSCIATPVFAGNVDDCEFLTGDLYSKGLYGLCIAYWNAENANARTRIGLNYQKKATGPNDPPTVPGGAACPCWTDTNLADTVLDAVPSACLETQDGTGIEYAYYNSYQIQFFILDDNDPNDPSVTGYCLYSENPPLNALDEGTEAACREDIYFLIDESFNGDCSPGS